MIFFLSHYVCVVYSLLVAGPLLAQGIIACSICAHYSVGVYTTMQVSVPCAKTVYWPYETVWHLISSVVYNCVIPYLT